MKPYASLFFLLLIAVLFLSCQKPPPQTKSPSPSPKTASVDGPPGFPRPVLNKPYPGTGVVTEINRDEGWIEINHEEIKDLMPAMQMEFNVQERALLDKAKVGDRVEFAITETEKGEYLTDIKKIPSP